MALIIGWNNGTFDALRDCDKHIRQYGASYAHSVDCDRGIVIPDLAHLPYLLAIAAYRSMPLSDFMFSPLLEDDITLTCPRFIFC